MVEQKGLKPAGIDSVAQKDNAAEIDERDLKEGQRRKSGQMG